MLLGKEAYSNKTLIPRGLALNPFSKIFYIWGNVILQSNDMSSYIYLSHFPGDSPIKYFVLSFTGHIAFVTDADEVWVMRESSLEIKRAYPSKAWSMYNTLQVMEGSQDHDLNARQAIVTVFFDKDGMQEDPRTTGKLIKRKFPLDHILTYDQLINTPHKGMTYNGIDYIRFTHRCPFAVIRMVDLPFPQRFTRMEHYRARPPEIMVKADFYDEKSLTVYQGLVYQLLQLHSAYHRSYADPVHDPTWRWWKNKKEDAEYYYYMASNRKSSGGIYVDMANYVKIYNLIPNNMLPKTIYLDKKQTFVFSVYLSIRTTKQSMACETWSVKQSLKIMAMKQKAFNLLPILQGNLNMGINIGCPPGKRLAFDITFTKSYTTEKNKRYFDCVKEDPEMPCFYFSDVVNPFSHFCFHRGVDQTTYCDYALEFIVHIHGLRISHTRSLYLLQLSMAITCGMLVLYIAVLSLGPKAKAYITRLFRRLEEAFAFRAASSLTFSSSFTSQSSLQHMQSETQNSSSQPSSRPASGAQGVDQTTYCDYALEFIVHIHGLRISHTRSLYLLQKLNIPFKHFFSCSQLSMAVIFSILVLYIAVLSLGPKAKAYITRLFQRLEEAFVFRAASSLTFTSSFTSQSSLQHMPSEINQNSSSPPSSKPNTPASGAHYIFTIIGGGAFSEDNIKYFTPEELLRYNTMNGSITFSESDVKGQSFAWRASNIDAHVEVALQYR
ncbi:hypothetical protein JD844_005903 [Phrynosoma platyrhinos]|uniref:Cation channel sperm-associated protein subunit gamma n=1 Tax=Phrynosoma platyrhinos TaxID=52577 RepID=A0ABQ7TQ87_PHRPL|nr:hypothetical protein JD844_005903 [Phrynosoma platyrhinos]